MDVYVMKNFTLKEVYFGLAEEEAKVAVNAHKSNDLSPIGHWKFDEEEIKWGVVQSGLQDQYAQAFMQALRREPQEDGWVVVVGME